MKAPARLLALGIAACAASTTDASAQSAELSITGRIPPSACSATLSNDGVVDLGAIRAQSLKRSEETLIREVVVPMQVACSSPIRFAFLGVDNTGDSATVASRYGLGFSPAGEKLGSYVISFEDPSMDGAPGYYTRSSDGGSRWDPSDNTGDTGLGKAMMSGFSSARGVFHGPEPVKFLQVGLRVRIYIAPIDTLTVTGDVILRGSTTIEMTYL